MEAERLKEITELIEGCQLEKAEKRLQGELTTHPDDDTIYYLLGNVQRKRSHWKEALQFYAHAIELNPESPALHAREMIVQIMDFYDKERYNV